MTQDILLLILPYLSTHDASGLLDVILSKEVLTHADNGVQKRGYKILARLVQDSKVSSDVEPMISRLDELSDGLSPAAKKVHLEGFCLIWHVTDMTLIHPAGSVPTICEPVAFNPSFSFAHHPVADS
jgi:hypothetical protein